IQQRRAPEGALRPVVQARRHDPDRRRRRESCRRPERDPRRAGLQRPELGVRVRRAFREDGDRAATREHATRRVECLPVLCGVGARVLTPVYGDRLERATEESDHRHPEQRRLGQERDAPGGETQQKRGIDQPARVVQDEDHATAVARICGETTLTIAELIGPVEANRHNSAATIAVQYTAGRGAASASSVSGAATSVTKPETQRYAWRETRRK